MRDPVDDAGCGVGDQLEVGGVADPADWAVHQLRLAAPADYVAARAAENLQTKVDRQTGLTRGYRAGADGGEADRTLDQGLKVAQQVLLAPNFPFGTSSIPRLEEIGNVLAFFYIIHPNNFWNDNFFRQIQSKFLQNILYRAI